MASEYRASRVFEDELCDPMIEELFIAAKGDDSYKKVLEVLRQGATKEQVKLLPPRPSSPSNGPAVEQNKSDGEERGQPDGLPGNKDCGPDVSQEEDQGVSSSATPGTKVDASGWSSTILVARWFPRGIIQDVRRLPNMCHLLSVQAAGA